MQNMNKIWNTPVIGDTAFANADGDHRPPHAMDCRHLMNMYMELNRLHAAATSEVVKHRLELRMRAVQDMIRAAKCRQTMTMGFTGESEYANAGGEPPPLPLPNNLNDKSCQVLSDMYNYYHNAFMTYAETSPYKSMSKSAMQMISSVMNRKECGVKANTSNPHTTGKTMGFTGGEQSFFGCDGCKSKCKDFTGGQMMMDGGGCGDCKGGCGGSASFTGGNADLNPMMSPYYSVDSSAFQVPHIQNNAFTIAPINAFANPQNIMPAVVEIAPVMADALPESPFPHSQHLNHAPVPTPVTETKPTFLQWLLGGMRDYTKNSNHQTNSYSNVSGIGSVASDNAACVAPEFYNRPKDNGAHIVPNGWDFYSHKSCQDLEKCRQYLLSMGIPAVLVAYHGKYSEHELDLLWQAQCKEVFLNTIKNLMTQKCKNFTTQSSNMGHQTKRGF